MALIVLIISALALSLAYSFCLSIYRLFVHPLARFPGPKLAAATKWYEAYFDIVKAPGGQYKFEIERMHDVYGPIVRVTPDEIHVRDSAWAETLFAGAGGGMRNKYPPIANMFGTPDAGFETIDHNLHRLRKSAINPFYSRKAVLEAQGMINDSAVNLCNRMSEQLANGGVASIETLYTAFASDVVYEHMFGEPWGLLDDMHRARGWEKTVYEGPLMTPLAKQFNWIIPLSFRIPLAVVDIILPDLSRVVRFRKDLTERARAAVREYCRPSKDSRNSKTFFDVILESENLSAADKSVTRLEQEGFTSMGAGTATTTRNLKNATYWILSDRTNVLKPLCKELREDLLLAGNRVDLRYLEQQPFLTAVIKETLRMSAVVSSRLPLVSPHEPLQYKDWVIPAGTPVSMTLSDIMFDPEIFEDPEHFKPQRWLEDEAKTNKLNRGFVPFGRGNRMCSGMHLAMAELYIALAMIIRRFDLELVNADFDRDIAISRDCFLGQVSPDSPGLKIRLEV